MAQILKGAPAAEALTEKLMQRCAELKEEGIEPCLAILRVGEKPDDLSYETGAMKRCARIGVLVKRFLLPADAGREEILAAVDAINRDRTIHGCLMFRPLPDRSVQAEACALLEPSKDADAMTAASLAGVFMGNGAGYPPCTAEAVLELLDYYGISVEGKRVTVIGRSLVIGRPLAMMLMLRNATVTICHTHTKDLAAVCKEAEILVSTAGRAGLVNASFLTPGQVVIDVGINVNAEGKLCGDVDFESAEPLAAAITPVPGGVGAMTTALLCRHVIESAEKNTIRPQFL